jgi:hypothetical protein
MCGAKHTEQYIILINNDDDPLRGSKHVALIKLYNNI